MTRLDARNTIATLKKLLADMGNTVLYMGAMDAINTKISALNYDAQVLAQRVGVVESRPVDTTTAAKVTALEAAVLALQAKVNALPPPYVSPVKNYEGVTNAQGTYTITFSPALAAIPYVQVALIGANAKDVAVVTRSAGSVSVTVQRRVDVLGLLPTYQVVASAAVSIQVTPK